MSQDDISIRQMELDASVVYEALVARRISYDQLMWQVPAISLAAQAFLIGVGVDVNIPRAVRAIALLLGVLSGALSMQLMAKQRYHEQVDSRYLREWEQGAHVHPVNGFAPHDPTTHCHSADSQTKAEALGLRPGYWVRKSSYYLWMWGLRLFLAATFGLLVWVAVA